MYEWDETKRLATLSARGIDFADMARFDWEHAETETDFRRKYNEPRWIGRGTIGGRLHIVVFTRRNGTIRVISLRKANKREIVRWKAKGRSGQ